MCLILIYHALVSLISVMSTTRVAFQSNIKKTAWGHWNILNSRNEFCDTLFTFTILKKPIHHTDGMYVSFNSVLLQQKRNFRKKKFCFLHRIFYCTVNTCVSTWTRYGKLNIKFVRPEHKLRGLWHADVQECQPWSAPSGESLIYLLMILWHSHKKICLANQFKIDKAT